MLLLVCLTQVVRDLFVLFAPLFLSCLCLSQSFFLSFRSPVCLSAFAEELEYKALLRSKGLVMSCYWVLVELSAPQPWVCGRLELITRFGHPVKTSMRSPTLISECSFCLRLC